MDEFLRYVVRELVEFPEEVILNSQNEDGRVEFQVSTRKSDIGRLIGREGATIRSIRDLLAASGEKHGVKTVLEIVE
jgi:predicted RNA-binding protein YlqC (UPF0109 family)